MKFFRDGLRSFWDHSWRLRAIVLSVFAGGSFGLELFRIRYVTLAAALTLILTIAPVYAAPNLKVGSTASYSLAASVSAMQSCSASPANYYNQACLGIYPPTVLVTISDDGHCGSQVSSDPFSALRCRFVPDNVTVSQGETVVWIGPYKDLLVAQRTVWTLTITHCQFR